ncbi:MAG: hypothetical protein JWR61_4214 [Ferruginibacter sp.]|uniref:hypothetical protein n=1 Tax=Ferruginibacter sp. TaxID=1940288 RepID=UPI002658A63D|nr:hypothetical protein [Ferruginibacter sp.]MDB5279259.1 hypothetical protein [Ferruginibacter sp.]
MKLLLFVSLLFTTNFQRRDLTKDFETYCNARFGYCIDYPTFLIPNPESENGDGRVFVNKEGTKVLTVYGRLNQDVDGNPVSLKRQYTLDIENLALSKAKITYQKLGKNFYVLSGEKNNRIFYQKMIAKKNSYCYSILEYNKLAKDVYGAVSVTIFKSFN